MRGERPARLRGARVVAGIQLLMCRLDARATVAPRGPRAPVHGENNCVTKLPVPVFRSYA